MPLSTKIVHDKDREIFEVHLSTVYTIILSFIMFLCAFMIIITSQILFFPETELHYTHTDRWKLVGSFLVLIIVHEVLHAVAAMLWGKVPWSSIHFGFKWQWFAFYCHCDRPLTVNTYRIFSLFPLIVTTLIAGLLFYFDSSLWILFLFCGAIAASAGDVLVFFLVRQVENDKWIQDHPSKLGFYILSTYASSSNPTSKEQGGTFGANESKQEE